jgi:tetratricopeptide (TPR) repeat protein
MSPRTLALSLLIAALTCACTLRGPPVGVPPAGAPGSAEPQPSPAAVEQPPAPRAPPPYVPPPKQFHLGAAANALVQQAHRQANAGDYGAASATLERAQRIEPDNPLVWLELGRLNLAENIPAQADAMGHKALALATGDPAASSAAWQLIAESLRARGRNAEAADAERHAGAAQPR